MRTVALRGWGFEDWDGTSGTVLANVSFLAGYRRRRLIAEDLVPVGCQSAATGSAIVDLERSVAPAPPGLVRPVVLHLLWTGELVTDITKPLDGLSFVKVREREAVTADLLVASPGRRPGTAAPAKAVWPHAGVGARGRTQPDLRGPATTVVTWTSVSACCALPGLAASLCRNRGRHATVMPATDVTWAYTNWNGAYYVDMGQNNIHLP